MRSFVFVLIFILAFFISVFAQEISVCPKIEVTGPSSAVRPSDTMIFVVNPFDNFEKYKFNWSVSNGNIIEGLGTPIIRVSTSGIENADIKATVKIQGLPEICNDEASEIGKVRAVAHPPLIDEYGKMPFSKEKLRLDQVVKEYREFESKYVEFKNAIIIIIFYKPKGENEKNFRIRQSKIKNYLMNSLKIPEDSFQFVFGGDSSYKTKFYFIPRVR